MQLLDSSNKNVHMLLLSKRRVFVMPDSTECAVSNIKRGKQITKLLIKIIHDGFAIHNLRRGTVTMDTSRLSISSSITRWRVTSSMSPSVPSVSALMGAP